MAVKINRILLTLITSLLAIAPVRAQGVVDQAFTFIENTLGLAAFDFIITFGVVFASILLAAEEIFRKTDQKTAFNPLSVSLAALFGLAAAVFVVLNGIPAVTLLGIYGILVSLILLALLVAQLIKPAEGSKLCNGLAVAGITALIIGAAIPSLLPPFTLLGSLAITAGLVLLAISLYLCFRKPLAERVAEATGAPATSNDAANQAAMQELQESMNQQIQELQNQLVQQNADPEQQEEAASIQQEINVDLATIREEIQEQNAQLRAEQANQILPLQQAIYALHQQVHAHAANPDSSTGARLQDYINKLEARLAALLHANARGDISINLDLGDFNQRIADDLEQLRMSLKQSFRDQLANRVAALERTFREEITKSRNEVLSNNEETRKELRAEIRAAQNGVKQINKELRGFKKVHKGRYKNIINDLRGLRRLVKGQRQEIQNILTRLGSLEKTLNLKLEALKDHMKNTQEPLIRAQIEKINTLQEQIAHLVSAMDHQTLEREEALEKMRTRIFSDIEAKLEETENQVAALSEKQNITIEEIGQLRNKLGSVESELKGKIERESTLTRQEIRNIETELGQLEGRVLTEVNGIETNLAETVRQEIEGVEKSMAERYEKISVMLLEDIKRYLAKGVEEIKNSVDDDMNSLRRLVINSTLSLHEHIERLEQEVQKLAKAKSKSTKKRGVSRVPPVPRPKLAHKPVYHHALPVWLFDPELRILTYLKPVQARKLHSSESFFDGQLRKNTATGNVERRYQHLVRLIEDFRNINRTDLVEKYTKVLGGWKKEYLSKFNSDDFSDFLSTLRNQANGWITRQNYPPVTGSEEEEAFVKRLGDFFRTNVPTAQKANSLFSSYKKFISKSAKLRTQIRKDLRGIK